MTQEKNSKTLAQKITGVGCLSVLALMGYCSYNVFKPSTPPPPLVCDASPTTQTITNILTRNGFHTKDILKIKINSSALDLKLNTGDWFSGSSYEIGGHLAPFLLSAREIIKCYPNVSINGYIVSPAQVERDQFGHKLPPSYAMLVNLFISPKEFRKYPKNFDFNSNSVYVANHFLILINTHLRKAWNKELKLERETGGFPED